MDNVKKTEDLYFDALLKISEKDEESAVQLLASEGIDAKALINNTLRKINGYEFELMKKVALEDQERLLNTLTEKISFLMQKAPERVSQIVNSFIRQRVPAFNFKNTSYGSDIATIFDHIDAPSLLEKLEALEHELH